MTTARAAEIIKENAMYLALLNDTEGQEELKDALLEQVIEAKLVLAATGVFAI